MCTIKDVAQEADVSVATVSAVINRNKYVSPELKERVLNAIDKLNYKPNRLASSLVKGHNNSVAYVVPTVSNPIFSRTLKGIEQEITDQGFNTILYNTNFDFNLFKKCVQFIIEYRIKGVVITSTRHPELKQEIEKLQDRGVHIVVVHAPRNIENVHLILGNDKSGVTKAVNELIKNGYKKIGFVGVDRSLSTQIRLEGYKSALEENNILIDDNLIYLGNTYDHESGYNGGTKLLKETDAEVIFATSDLLATGILSAAYDNNVNIPEELGVVGFDDTLAHLTTPKLSSIYLPCFEIGKRAAKKLIKKIKPQNNINYYISEKRNMQEKPPKKEMIEEKVKWRQSTIMT